MQINNLSTILNMIGTKDLMSLCLHEGQHLSARVVNANSEQALFNIRGEQFNLKLPTNVPNLNSGDTVLFEVHQTDSGQVELKILLPSSQTASTAASSSNDNVASAKLPGDPIIPAETNVQFLSKSVENLLSRLQLEQGIIADPQTAAFMVEQELPPTSGGYLLGWLQQHGAVREKMWDLFERAGMLNEREIPQMNQQSGKLIELITKAFANDNEAVKMELSNLLEAEIPNTGEKTLASTIAEKGAAPTAEQLQSTAEHKESLSPETAKFISKLLNEPKTSVVTVGREKIVLEQSELQKLGEVLTDRSTWAKLPDNKVSEPQTLNCNDVAFLIREPHGEVRECVIHWEEQSKKAKNDVKKHVEILRMVVPTENMGDLQMELQLIDGRATLNFSAENANVCEYLMFNKSGFEAVVAKELTLRVGHCPKKSSTKSAEGGLDLWL